MGQLGHIVDLVELGRIHFVDTVGIGFPLLTQSISDRHEHWHEDTYCSVVTLDKNPIFCQFFHNPTLDECSLRVLKPHIALPREIVFALDSLDGIVATSHVFRLDKGWCKGV